MTTDRQKTANRENARRSTGPKSMEGRARVSQNAKWHGLTARPEQTEIDRWVKILCDGSELDSLPSITGAGVRLATGDLRVVRDRTTGSGGRRG
jgi:hypothetical protein